MASDEVWKKLKHFKPLGGADNWGDVNAISEILLLALDDFRGYVNCPVHVTSGVETGGHSKKSYHYRENGACAVDVILPEYKFNAYDLIIDASRFGFTGIGYYPDWQFKGKRGNGLHLDMRPLIRDSDATLNYKHSRWIGIKEMVGSVEKQVYLPMSYENIKKYGGIYEIIDNINH